LEEWLTPFTKNTSPKLFIAGDGFIVEGFKDYLKYDNLIKTPVASSLGDHNVQDICSSIRKTLKIHSRKSLEKSLREFQIAENEKRTCSNLFQITKAVVEGRVRKIIVADDVNVFGMIDKSTGLLSIHPFDLDHEDDDVLDDLAQLVLSQGGEVVIASRREIPKSLPILAILDIEKGPVKNFKAIQVDSQPILKQRGI